MSHLEQLQRELGIYKGLVEVSGLISAITDFDELLAAILDVTKRVMRAEASSIFLADPERNVRLAIARGPAGEITKANIVMPRGRGISGWVIEHAEPALVPDAYADARFFADVDKKTGYRTRSVLCVPLTSDGCCIGALQALNPTDKAAFDEEDVEAFTAYANLAATAMDKLRALDRQRQQERVTQELTFAHEIQRSFLPQTLPDIGNLTFASCYRPAQNIGGDFYDVLPTAPDAIYTVIGDVSGKGTPAALLMAQSLSLLRFILTPGISPTLALERWNEMLRGRTIRGMFITSTIARITPEQRRIELASAGHCAPFLLSRTGVHDITIRNAPPLGILDHVQSHGACVTLEPGEWLVFFTDGLSESSNAADELLERDGLRKMLTREFHSAADVVSALQRGEAEHRGDAPPNDDLTMLVFGFR